MQPAVSHRRAAGGQGVWRLHKHQLWLLIQLASHTVYSSPQINYVDGVCGFTRHAVERVVRC